MRNVICCFDECHHVECRGALCFLQPTLPHLQLSSWPVSDKRTNLYCNCIVEIDAFQLSRSSSHNESLKWQIINKFCSWWMDEWWSHEELATTQFCISSGNFIQHFFLRHRRLYYFTPLFRGMCPFPDLKWCEQKIVFDTQSHMGLRFLFLANNFLPSLIFSVN